MLAIGAELLRRGSRQTTSVPLTPLSSCGAADDDDDDMADDLSDDELLFVARLSSGTLLAPLAHYKAVSGAECLARVRDALDGAASMVTLVFSNCADYFHAERCALGTQRFQAEFTLAPGYFDDLHAALDSLLQKWQEDVRQLRVPCCVSVHTGPGFAIEFAFRTPAETACLVHALQYRHSLSGRTWKRPLDAAASASLCVIVTMGRPGYGAEECGTGELRRIVALDVSERFVLPMIDTYMGTRAELVQDGTSTMYALEPF